jgi:hypothetical protein
MKNIQAWSAVKKARSLTQAHREKMTQEGGNKS